MDHPTALFTNYRNEGDRKLMAEHVLRTRYNWDTRPEILAQVIEEISGLNHIGIAYLYLEAKAGAGNQVYADYDASAWSGR